LLSKIKLSNSRKACEEAVWHQDIETFIRCNERGLQLFGDIAKVIKIDNLKSAVPKAHLYEKSKERKDFVCNNDHKVVVSAYKNSRGWSWCKKPTIIWLIMWTDYNP